VGRPDGIDVVLLHQPNVANHEISVHHMAPVGVVLMPVHPLDQDRLSVHKQLSPRDLHVPESGPTAHHFQLTAATSLSVSTTVYRFGVSADQGWGQARPRAS